MAANVNDLISASKVAAQRSAAAVSAAKQTAANIAAARPVPPAYVAGGEQVAGTPVGGQR